LSHEPKNYALLGYDGHLTLKGVAFRSSRAEPFGEDFLRRAIRKLLIGDVPGVREAYVETAMAIRRRELPTRAMAARVRLTKTPQEYLATRGQRRELTYEALLCAGKKHWSVGDRIRVYRAAGDRAGLLVEDHADPARDYDVEYYVRLLRETFASRLARGLAAEDYAHVVADPQQYSLFEFSLASAKPVLTKVP
jgi:DNA polymerase elongation subunit (family B)